MADSVANLLLRFASESDPAKRDVRGLIGELESLERSDASAEASVTVDDGGLTELATALRAFGAQKASARADINATSGFAKLGALHAAYKGFMDEVAAPPALDLHEIRDEVRELTRTFEELSAQRDAIANKKIGRESGAAKIGTDIARIREEIRRLESLDPRLKLDAEIQKGEAALDVLMRKWEALSEGGGDKVSVIDPVAIQKGEARINSLMAKLEKLQAVDPKIQVDADIRKAEADLALLERSLLRQISDEDPDPLQVEKTRANIDVVEARLNRLRSIDPNIQIASQIEEENAELDIAIRNLEKLKKGSEGGGAPDPLKIAEVEADIARVEARLADLRNQTPEIEIKLKIDRLRAEMGLLEAELTKIGDLDIEADLKTARIEGQMAQIAGEIALLDAQRVEIEMNVDRDGRARSVLGSIAQKFSQVTSALESGGSAAGQAGGLFSRLTVNLGSFGARLSPLVGAILAVVVTIGGSLVVALTALASAAAFAAAAIGALATALVAAAGPAVMVAIAAFTRLAAVFKAVQASEKAEQAESKKTAEGMRAAAQAAEERRNAGLRVADALRNITTAERGVQQAEESAADAIANANMQVADSARALEDANRQVADATEEAYKDMKQAIEDVEEAMLSLEGAQLGIEDADLETRKAVLALKELRGELGATGKGMESAFEKFTDVDFDFKDLKSALAQAGVGGPAAQLSEADSIKLEEAILRVRKAKLGEKQATNTLENAENTLTEARKKQNEYAKEGISAYEPLTAAIRSQQDATRTLARATAQANELNQQGVKNAPAVVAAYESLAAARRNYNEALRQQRVVRERTATTPQADEAKRQRDELTDPEKSLADTIAKAKDALKGFFTPITDQIISAIDRAIKKAPALLLPLHGSFMSIGEAFAAGIDTGMSVLTDPANADAIATIVDGSAQLAKIFSTDIFKSFLQVFLDVAEAAMPHLIELTKSLATYMRNFAKSTSDKQSLIKFLFDAMEALKSIGAFVISASKLFIAFFVNTRVHGVNLIDMFTGLLNKITAFLESPRGKKEISQFMEDVIPLAVAFGRVLGQAFILLFRVIQAIAPALTGILNIVADVIAVINVLVTALMPVLQVGFQIAALFYGGLVGGIRAFIFILGFLASIFPATFRALGQVVIATVALIAGIFRGLLDILTWPFKQLINLLDGLVAEILGFFLNLGTDIVSGIASGLSDLGNSILGFFKRAVNAVLKFLGIASPSTFFIRVGKSIVEGIKTGLLALVNVLLWPFRKGLELLGGLKDRFIRGATRIVGWVKEGLSTLKDILVKPFTSALEFLLTLRKRFLEIGGKILSWLGEGIKKAPKAIWNGFKDALGKLGDLLPGSEPKDKRSPLTGLKKRGTSIFTNLAEGFEVGARNMSLAMTHNLVPVVDSVEANISNPGRLQALQPSGGGPTTHIEKQELILPEQAPGEGYDPKVAAIDMARELRRRR